MLTPLPLPVVFDLETTGLPHTSDKVVPWEIHARMLDPTRPGWPEISAFHAYMVLPEDAEWSPRALEMVLDRGLSPEWINENGNTRQLVYQAFATWLRTTADGLKKRLSGHNAATFDIPLLRRDAYRYGLDMDTVVDYHPGFDTALLSQWTFEGLHPEWVGSSLSKLAPFLGVPYTPPSAHSAEYDTEVTAECLRVLMGVHPDIECPMNP